MEWVSVKFSSMTEHLLCAVSAVDTGMNYPQRSPNLKGIKKKKHHQQTWNYKIDCVLEFWKLRGGEALEEDKWESAEAGAPQVSSSPIPRQMRIVVRARIKLFKQDLGEQHRRERHESCKAQDLALFQSGGLQPGG